VPRWPDRGWRGTLTAMPVLTRSAISRGFDLITHHHCGYFENRSGLDAFIVVGG